MHSLCILQHLPQTTMALRPTQSDIDQSACPDGHDKPTARTAPSPFDDPKADLIIRSSDNTHFYVHKSLLSIVSPVFEGMLTLPGGTSQEVYDDRLCLPVSDDSHHLLCLLSWCDPRCKRPSPSLDDLTMTLEVASKYGMSSIVAHAQSDLSALDSVESEPLKVFAIAIRFRLDKVAQKAAQVILRVPLARCHNSPQLKHISAFAVQNLHNYHYKCKIAVRYLLASDSWAQAMKAVASYLMSCKEAKGEPHTHGVEYFSLKKVLIMGKVALWLSEGHTAPWWTIYTEAMMITLEEQPSGFSVPRPLPTGRIQRSISLDKCTQCKKHGYARLNEVSKYLSKKIDEVVLEVRKR